MRYLVVGSAIIVVLIVAVVIVGYTLPVKHRAIRSAVIHASQAQLAAMIGDVGHYAEWRNGVKRVELISTNDTSRRYGEQSSDGTIEYVMDTAGSPSRIVTTISGGVRAFGGRWTYDLAPRGETTALQITEDGEVYNPLFRFIARFIIGQTATIDRYFSDLQRRIAAQS
ncbi:MAG TPA: SRPBCC family protein [Gemmatimonadales bacterium]|jgi:hypothetical protein